MKFIVKSILSFLAICPFPAVSAMAAAKMHNLAGEEQRTRKLSDIEFAGRAIFPENEYITTIDEAKKRIMETFKADSETAEEILQGHIDYLSDRSLVQVQENEVISASRSWGRGD